MPKLLEVEINGPRNEEFCFAPVQDRLRGRIELGRMTNGYRLAERFPLSIPGQRIEYNLDTDECAIVEAIHDEPSVKSQLEKQGFAIGPKRRELGKVDRPTYLFWIKRAIESGIATLLKGNVPEIEGKPQVSFVNNHETTTNDKLAAAIEKQNEIAANQTKVMELLLAAMAKK
jgi:hypothetical protein